MRKHVRKLVFGAFIVFVAAGLVLFARGPEGTAIAKETEDRVTAVSTQFQWRLVEIRSVPPANVPLPLPVALKHQIKGAFRSTSIVLWTQEHATDYRIESIDGQVRLHCLVRYQGDLVIGICVRYSSTTSREAAQHFGVALSAEFPGYRILTAEEDAE